MGEPRSEHEFLKQAQSQFGNFRAVNFFEALWGEAVVAKTPYLVLLVLVAMVFSRAAHVRPRFRGVLFFTGMHVVTLLLGVGLKSIDSTLADEFRIPSWVFGSVAFVASGAIVLFGTLLPTMRFHVPRILQDVLVAILAGAVAVTVAGRAGANLSGLIATSAVLTAILGFSLQDVIGNVAGGLALQIDTSVEVGDWISVNDISGRVTEVRWRYTAVETRNWETVLIPNIVLLRNHVKIMGRRAGQPTLWRRWVKFNVDFQHQPSDVIEVVEASVRGARIARVAVDPAPQVLLMELGSSSAEYAVRYWLSDMSQTDATDSEIRTRIYFGLQRAEIALSMPSQHVLVTQEDQQREAAKTEKQVTRRRTLLERVDLFGSLSADERNELAKTLRYAPFSRGEVMTRQGAEAHWLYLIEEGTASVRIGDGVVEKEVAKLGSFSFFGEMSLLTGQPRAATVVAETDVECFRLEKAGFQKVLEKRPELAKDFAAALSKRSVELDAAREGLDAETARKRQKSSEADLFGQIKAFFRLR